MELASFETPSTDARTLAPALDFMEGTLTDLGLRVRRIRGSKSGGHLLGIPPARSKGVPGQLLMGHLDTVWPLGTLESMPHVREGNRIRGPGVYDMKGGIAQIIFALETLSHLNLTPSVTPVVFANSDEEIGSRETSRHVRRVAKVSDRVLVLEPSLGQEGLLKTARKGVGRIVVSVLGVEDQVTADKEIEQTVAVDLEAR